MTEDRNQLAVSQMPMLNPDYLQPQDYLRPLIGVTVYSLIFTFPPYVVGFLWGTYPPSFPLGLASMMIGTFLISAMVHHFIWWRRLKTQGADAFIAVEDLDLPLGEAFELCLAATTQLRNARMEAFEDCQSISVRIKADFWNATDRLVEIRFEQLDDNKTRIMIDYSAKLTAFRSYVIEKIWGPKWAPIFYRLDGKKNKETLSQITDYLQRVPEWNHKYVYGDSFGDRQVA
jgi:hypothetical protein